MDPNSLSISDIAIRRPVFTTMVMVAMMVLGLVSFFRLGVDLFPDISFPVVAVTTPYPGAGPAEVEELVTRPVEESVASLSGIDTVRSYSREGVSVVIVTFKIGTDIKMANVDVRDRVTAVHNGMPTDVMESTYLRLDPSAMPIMTLVLGGDSDPRETRRLADETIRPILEQADGVASVDIRGGAEREIGVELYADKLAHYGLSVGQVSQALGVENLNVPSGRIEDARTETVVRMQGQFTDVKQIGETVVGQFGGEPVRVQDVGDVVDHAVDRRTLGRSVGEVSSEIQAGIDAMGVPAGYSVSFGGETKQMRESAQAFGVALSGPPQPPRMPRSTARGSLPRSRARCRARSLCDPRASARSRACSSRPARKRRLDGWLPTWNRRGRGEGWGIGPLGRGRGAPYGVAGVSVRWISHRSSSSVIADTASSVPLGDTTRFAWRSATSSAATRVAPSAVTRQIAESSPA